ncbi:RNA-directed DNA polymerase from mobile element jockey [Elysia marginata]|uniref:RNA-directed DNA polymerase from mobile element jockey n=1 Tax=Elysia marginata TaxID=1093978 RepID=A0AAV4I9Y7_9GAST|nr:RNA-directed DNA polymerase from mobile element jockey [Elysia marginata]
MGGKRGAESVFSTLAPHRIYLNVESVGGESVSDLSPFRLHREIMGILGRECKISKTKRGVMLEVARKSDEEKLTKMKELGGLKVKVTRDTYLNTSRGVINHKDLRGSKEEEFVEWIPGVISARRIEIKRGEERIKTNTYVLTFDYPTPPSDYLPVKVRPYVPTPMCCFRCHRFGRGRDRCRAREELCVKCGEPGHRGEECKKELRCVNCKGEHPANSKSCPKYKEEQAILRYRAYNGGTFGQARAAVVVEVAKEVRPKLYAQAVRGGPTRKVTAPVSTQNKIESLPVARNSATRRAGLTNNKPRTEETRKPLAGSPPPSQQPSPSQQCPPSQPPRGPLPRRIQTVGIWHRNLKIG